MKISPKRKKSAAFIRDIAGCRRGMAMVEFAFVLPIIILMLIAAIEVTRFAIVEQKLDKVVNSMANFVTQGLTVSQTDLDAYVTAASELMMPYTFSGTIIFSSVTQFSTVQAPCNTPNVACISWQSSELGADPSKIGAVGGVPVLPGGYTVNPGDNVIVVEAYMNYAPMLTATSSIIPALAPQQIYKVAVYKPRQGTLTTLGN